MLETLSVRPPEAILFPFSLQILRPHYCAGVIVTRTIPAVSSSVAASWRASRPVMDWRLRGV